MSETDSGRAPAARGRGAAHNAEAKCATKDAAANRPAANKGQGALGAGSDATATGAGKDGVPVISPSLPETIVDT